MKNWDASIQIPTNSEYILRILEEKFAPNNNGNPMITLTAEVASPTSVNVNGEDINIAGIKIPLYYVTQVMDDTCNVDAEKTAAAQARTFSNNENNSLYQLFEIPVTPDQYNNPPLGFVGKCVYARVKPDAKVKRDSPTAEDLKKGLKEGKVSVNPKTKKPIHTFYPKVEEIYGLAETSNSPY